ncbi:hypothetical protein DFR24_0984 [Panacagrimonas perspica]|uniref:Uncharacterized protein n=1 Tax=Panacagrimonas perspica TaxID=381431 RepID=A0A4R7PC06_9GAMM|nr:hypothetical protein [Panacagrimonas perspica]TDU31613.1 hypothetical protein DFR24_0984 [Panacagrimonas perspica]THD03161.1 hypothetical protein B1810_11325 [Panacagrimonas perspica]
MLRDDAQVLPSAAAARFKILSRLAMSSIAGMFGLHLWIAFSLIVGHEVGHFLEVLIVWLAITMMAGRAFEEGLQPGREIERYSHYRANLKRLLRLLDQADSAPEKQRLMSEAERIVYQELRGFLLLHEDSKFVL